MFNNLKLKHKLVLAFIMVSSIAAIVGIVGYLGIINVNGSLNSVYGQRLPALQALLTISKGQAEIIAAERMLLLPTIDRVRTKRQNQVIDEAWKQIRQGLKTYNGISRTTQEEEIWKKLKLAMVTWEKDRQVFMALYEDYRKTGDPAAYEKVMIISTYTANKSYQVSQGLLNQIIELNKTLAAKESKKAGATTSYAIQFLYIILAAGFGFAIILGIWLANRIVKPIAQLAEAVELASNGDLTTEIITGSKDEIGQLATSFNQMAADLRNIVYQVIHAAETVAVASQDLFNSSSDTSNANDQVVQVIGQLATGAVNQAESLSETNSIVLLMSQNTQQVALNAQSVSQSVIKAVEEAKEGLTQSETAVRTMQEIKEITDLTGAKINELGKSSQKVGQIIEVIKGIATQTNLLALNAAIEAARAGEMGRGFAVVAEEVRKLAEQASASTEQITFLIAGIQKETEQAINIMNQGSQGVTEGVDAVNAAGSSFRNIALEIDQIAQEIQEVSTAAQQMAGSSEQIVQSVGEIAAIAEQTSASAQEVSSTVDLQSASIEETTSATQSLTELGKELQSLLSKFKIKKDGSGLNI